MLGWFINPIYTGLLENWQDWAGAYYALTTLDFNLSWTTIAIKLKLHTVKAQGIVVHTNS